MTITEIITPALAVMTTVIVMIIIKKKNPILTTATCYSFYFHNKNHLTYNNEIIVTVDFIFLGRRISFSSYSSDFSYSELDRKNYFFKY